MIDEISGGNGLIAAERRRRVYELALRTGSVNVSELADLLGVAAATIRRDLNVLDNEGKLVRSHGGAMVKPGLVTRPEYADTRDSYMTEKAAIGAAAAALLPHEGFVALTGGTTTRELALRVPADLRIRVVTTSVEIAYHLVTHTSATVHVLGGVVRPDTSTINCISDPALDMLYWDTTFLSVAALDVEAGLTTVDTDAALCMRRIISRGNKLVLLCDSSKLGCYSHAQVGPVTMADVLVTDPGASPDFLEAVREKGVEVVVAGTHGSGRP